MRLVSILFVVYFVLFFVLLFVGWVMPEYYVVGPGESHILGLKFMPPCSPVAGNATCGYDNLLLILIMFPFVSSLFGSYVSRKLRKD